MLINILTIVGYMALSGLFGSLIFFSSVVAPLIFIKLETKTAGKFIRSIFPWYYLSVIILAVLSGLCFAFEYPVKSIIMGLIGCSALYSRQYLMPRINKQRDLMLGGDQKAELAFKWMHRFSVWINGVQLIVVSGILINFLAADLT